MSETIVRDIPLDAIAPWEGNRRVGKINEAKLQELAESIRETGVHQPAIVRQVDGAYQLVAGERRWRASRIAGQDTLPCIVRELADGEVLRIQIIENLQREDVHPLDEAEGFGKLLAQEGYDVDELAGDVGRSKSYIYQRLKLRDLVDKGRARYISGELSTTAAIAIARLPIPVQNKLLKDLGDRLQADTVTHWIEHTVFQDLRKVAFRLDDAGLVPEAGTCTTCPKRSGASPELFPEVAGKSDVCLDAECLRSKQGALIKLQEKRLADEKTKFIRIAGKDDYTYQKDVERPYDYQGAKKSDPKAKVALVVSGPDAGRIIHVKKRTYQQVERRKLTEEEKREQLERDVTWQLERRLPAAIADAVADTIAGSVAGGHISTPLLVDVLAAFCIADYYDSDIYELCGFPQDSEPPFDEIRAALDRYSRRDLELILVRFAVRTLSIHGMRHYNADEAVKKRLDELVSEHQVDVAGIETRLRDQVRAELQSKTQA